jgi:single-stranded-DNA-specific exonuclease
MRKRWKISTLTSYAKELASKYNISPILAQLLLNRKIKEEDFFSFLNPQFSSLYSPFFLPDMEKTVLRIKKAVEKKEKVLVVGDYDVDGITSLAIFYEFAKEFKDIFSFYIPHRLKDGYGLNQNIVEEAKDKGISLIVCFDCGTNSFSEVELAKKFNIDVIVIDHHQIKQDNFSFAFINPKRKDSFYPFPHLSSAALSFKLLQALKNTSCKNVLDLVSLSLVCDVVPLQGENRILLKEGLKWIRKSDRASIKLLCQISGIRQENITPFHIGYILGPRINASGRVAYAGDSLNIFLSEDEREVSKLVNKLERYNQLRKEIENGVFKEAEFILDREHLDKSAIVIERDGWHLGVLGVVASKLVEKYCRPVILFSLEDNLGIGSARSIPSLSLIEVLDKCSDYLLVYGGHRKAAGIKIFKENIEKFRKKVNEKVEEIVSPQDLVPTLEVDLELSFKDINIGLVNEIEKLFPYGEENPPPLFASFKVSKKTSPKKVNNGYSIWLTQNERTFEGIVYDKDIMQIIEYGDCLDIVYSLENNTYYNNVRLVIKDCRLSEGKS